jgi:hypothetical protein
VFKVGNAQMNQDRTITIQWQSVTNKLYRVNRSLIPSFDNYTTLTSDVPGTPPVNSFTDTTATNTESFYWIELQP